MGALLPICCSWKPCRELVGRALPPGSAWELLIQRGCCSGSCQPNPCRLILAACPELPACHPRAWNPTGRAGTLVFTNLATHTQAHGLDICGTFLSTTWTSHFLSWAVFGVMGCSKAESRLGIYFYFPLSGSFAVSWVVPIPSAQLELLAKGLREWEDLEFGFMHVPQPRPVSWSVTMNVNCL